MEAKELDRIEKFLSGKLSAEENALFEKELRESKELAEQTKKVAYIIHSINVVGLKRDNERIRRVYASVSGDYKRFVASVAAMLAVVLVFATVVSVPVYKYVVKPVVEKIFHSSPAPEKKQDVVPVDSIVTLPMDTLSFDTIVSVAGKQPQPVAPPVVKKAVKVESEIKQVVTDTIVPIKVDTVEPQVVKPALIVEAPKPANRIISYSRLENYQFGDVTARREGKNVVCSFIMWNDVENAKIQMHSARAKDNQGKNYPAKNCLLNGKSKRIIEEWKRDEKHLIEITIVDVPTDIVEFESISFSFQSEGDSLKQKSQSIVLKVGEIK